MLLQLNALDENENLTPLGYHLAKLPLDPQVGKMLLMGVTMSCLNPILSIAATLTHKDPFYLPIVSRQSMKINVFEYYIIRFKTRITLQGEERALNERKLVLDKGHKSDHLIMAEVIDQWERLEKDRNRNKVRAFIDENFLTRGNLYQLRDMKLQFAQYLCELGFLSNTDYKQKNLNMNSDNVALVKAVVCSGLYPNVAIIE